MSLFGIYYDTKKCVDNMQYLLILIEATERFDLVGFNTFQSHSHIIIFNALIRSNSILFVFWMEAFETFIVSTYIIAMTISNKRHISLNHFTTILLNYWFEFRLNILANSYHFAAKCWFSLLESSGNIHWHAQRINNNTALHNLYRSELMTHSVWMYWLNIQWNFIMCYANTIKVHRSYVQYSSIVRLFAILKLTYSLRIRHHLTKHIMLWSRNAECIILTHFGGQIFVCIPLNTFDMIWLFIAILQIIIGIIAKPEKKLN